MPTNTSEKSGKEFFIEVGNIKVPVLNPHKIYFPDDKVTKKMVVEYYQSIAEYILPFLKDRPQSLKRNPNGINDTGFFHKYAGEGEPKFIKSFPVWSESSDKEIDYIICNNKATLPCLNNLGRIEINPRHSTTKKPENPDHMIFDMAPSDKNTFDRVVGAAPAFKTILDKAGTKSFCKTSCSTGLHIYIPMKKKYDYEEVKNFAHLISMMVCEMLPDFTTLERNFKKRGDKMKYPDYLQNRKSQTISSVYSLRPMRGAMVSMPLKWEEVKRGLNPTRFTIFNALQRIHKNPYLFNGVMGAATDIRAFLKKRGN